MVALLKFEANSVASLNCTSDCGSIALLLHFTSSEVLFLDLVFLHGAGGPGNPFYGVQVRNCKFRTSLLSEVRK